MAVYLVSGDDSMISLESSALIDRLVGDEDRSMMLEDYDCADSASEDWSLGPILDAVTTMSLFMDKRVVLVRHLHSLRAEFHEQLAEAIEGAIPEVDLVLTNTGKMPKLLADACKTAKAETIGTAVGTRTNDRIAYVESKFVEAGFTYSPDVARTVATWFGGEQSRISGLIATLLSTYGENAKLSRSDVEVFLGDAGSIAPWDLTDAIDKGDANGSLVMLHRMLGDSHPFQILALLANRYAQMMKIDGRDVRTADQAKDILGGSPFTAKKVLEQYQRLGSAGIARAIALIAEADVDLRGGKDWPDELVMEVLVARLARLAGPTRTTSRR